MAKQQRQNAPDAPKADGAGDNQAEQSVAPDTLLDAQNAPDAPKADGAGAADDEPSHARRECPACMALNGERPCSIECYVAAGYDASNYEKHFGVPAAAALVVPEGMVRCRAITTCLVRGMPEFAGAEFWLAPDQADRLEDKGALEKL
jgi:hypothetical protein